MSSTKEFSIEGKLMSLVELQKIECKLDHIDTIRGELPLQVSELEDTIEGVKNRIKRIEEEINGIHEFIEQKKEYIKQTELTVKKYEKQSKNVKNSREFEALDKEIKYQTLELKLSEKYIANATEEAKQKVADLDAAKKEIQDKQFFLNQKKEELESINVETEKDEKHYLKLADGAKKDIDEKLVRSYERIRKNYKNGLGIVAIIREACGGCFSSIPPQKQSEIKQRKNIHICENCGRILVDEELYNKVKVK